MNANVTKNIDIAMISDKLPGRPTALIISFSGITIPWVTNNGNAKIPIVDNDCKLNLAI